MPFGFDAPLWRLMGAGIEGMTGIAQWVAGLPGALGRVPAFGVGALLVATAGLIVMCLLKSRLRWAGVALIALAGGMAATAVQPDVLISSGGDVVAARTAGGKLSAVRFGSDSFAIRDWLAADADARAPNDAALKSGFACDSDGCAAKLADGAIVAAARTPAALAEDCARAALVITTREAPPGCAATVIDRAASRTGGAMAIARDGKGFRIERSYPGGYDRPWARRGSEPPAATSSSRPAARDATPREEDLEAGD
jgi:competence protein ComEC